ncbi:PHD finger protein 7-like isoform X5 [Pipra filicauda]|uniref:PHD finger protein 7-like isoform X5 n=1 Tax=Pipra filicauda TaxID=649802 RepID=A0A7R5KR91_9PASS|nr:PHD finger protein 7-like isoform X5 [Pipra filicauda]XP_039243786.1 PHD finger protein 7-like isoform X5 [Pipra filicauda]
MSDREEEAPEGREPECLLCRRSDADLDICGDKIQKHGICAHVFCLYFASILDQQGNERVGLQGFLPRDILHAVKRAAQTSCCICGQSGATISCCETDCDLSFHLPCAKQGGCVTQFIPPYSSYCPAHSPQQAVEATPEPGTECLICMEPVEDRKTFNTMVCPACKTTWFHRDCIQGQALRSGFSSFQCPICRNRPAFLGEMFTMGIRIPFRPPTWEENDAFAELLDRHRRCDASECFYPRGRQEAEEEGPWELLLCSCAAEVTLRHCSGLRGRDPPLTRPMSDREEEPPEVREPGKLPQPCRGAMVSLPSSMPAVSTEADPDMCGENLQINGLCVHKFCLYFASHLLHRAVDRVGLSVFTPRDILDVVSWAAQKTTIMENHTAFNELGDRHRHCDASECLFPGGRQEAEEEGPWELLLCSSCAAEGTPRHCSGLRDIITSWECDGCAGLGTASS